VIIDFEMYKCRCFRT